MTHYNDYFIKAFIWDLDEKISVKRRINILMVI